MFSWNGLWLDPIRLFLTQEAGHGDAVLAVRRVLAADRRLTHTSPIRGGPRAPKRFRWNPETPGKGFGISSDGQMVSVCHAEAAFRGADPRVAPMLASRDPRIWEL